MRLDPNKLFYSLAVKYEQYMKSSGYLLKNFGQLS